MNVLKFITTRRVTDNLFQYPHKLGDPIGISYYNQEFYNKPSAKREPIRTGTASGKRNNRPHPTKVNFNSAKKFFFLFSKTYVYIRLKFIGIHGMAW